MRFIGFRAYCEATLGFTRLVSICSRVFPRVSGTPMPTRIAPDRHTAPYTKKVPEMPIEWFSKGKV